MSPARFIFAESSDVLGQWGWEVGSTVTYKYQPLDVGRSGVRQGSAVNNLIVQHLHGDLGLADWLTVGLDMPVAWSYQYRDLINDPNASATRHTAAGDLRLSVKAPILDRNKYGVGVAWENWFTMPTGRESHFLGHESLAAAGVVIVDGAPAPWVTLGMNLGYIAQDHTAVAGVLDSDDQFALQAAVAFDVEGLIGIITEASILTETKHFFSSRDSTPFTIRQGVRWDINGNWRIEAGGEVGLIHGIGVPRGGGYLGFRYLASKVPKEIYAPPAMPVPAVVPAPAVAPVPAPVAKVSPPRPEVSKAGLSTIRKMVISFPLGSSILTPEAQAQIEGAAQMATADATVTKVRFKGYAADVLKEGDMCKISTDRARAAAQYFMSLIGRPVDMFYHGLGANYPTGRGADADRRVEVIFIYKR